jgi:hypothetical protein
MKKVVLIFGVLALLAPICLYASVGQSIDGFYQEYSWRTSLMDVWCITIFWSGLLLIFDRYKLSVNNLLLAFLLPMVFFVVKGALYENFHQSKNITLFVIFSLMIIIPTILVLHSLNKHSNNQYSELKQSMLDEDPEKGKGASQDHASFLRLIQLAREEYSTLVYASLALVISSACSLAQPYYFGEIINACSDEDTDKLKRIIFTLSVIFVVGGFFTFIRGYLYSLVGERLVRVIRRQLFECIIRQDISFFDINKTGELMNRLSADTTVIQSSLSVNVSMGLRSLAMIFVSTILLFVTSWKLTLVVSQPTQPPILLVSSSLPPPSSLDVLSDPSSHDLRRSLWTVHKEINKVVSKCSCQGR